MPILPKYKLGEEKELVLSGSNTVGDFLPVDSKKPFIFFCLSGKPDGADYYLDRNE